MPASAQQPPLKDALLDQLIGDWVLSGTVARKPTTHDLDASWALNHQFVRMHEVSREKTDKGEPQYEAYIFIGWDAMKSQYVVHWIDVFGGGFSMQGYAAKLAGSIPFVFKSSDGDFYTAFTFDVKTKSWDWTMDNAVKGKRIEFARLKMVRKPAGAPQQ